MAVYIDISESQHLAYSPLNNKHNILYQGARQSVNQPPTRKQRFHPAAFWQTPELAKHKAYLLKQFTPEGDGLPAPLESLTIVEDYFEDSPQLIKEFEIGEFWEYLFSDKWKHGFAIRVLEGRLQDMIIRTLNDLTKNGAVSQHSTVAYAKNRRPHAEATTFRNTARSSQQTLGGGEGGRRCKPETLLLEFVYYGRSNNKTCVTRSSDGYPLCTTCSSSTLTVSPPLHVKDELIVRPPSTPISSAQKSRHKILKRRSQTSSHSLSTTPNPEFSDNRITRRSSSFTKCTTRDVTSARRQQSASTDSTAIDHELIASMHKLGQFHCSERVDYLGEFYLSDDDDDSLAEVDLGPGLRELEWAETEPKEEFEDFGQEYYLGEIGEPAGPKASTEQMLKERKKILEMERMNRQELMLQEEAFRNKHPLPIMDISDLDIYKYMAEHEITVSAKEDIGPVPSLESYCRLLENEESQLKASLKRRFFEMCKQYFKPEPKIKPKPILVPYDPYAAECVGAITGSLPCKLHWKKSRDLKPLLQRKVQKPEEEPEISLGLPGNYDPSRDTPPHIYITGANGMTRIDEVSADQKFYEDMKRQIEKVKKVKNKPQPEAREVLRPTAIPLTRKPSKRNKGRPGSNTTKEAVIEKTLSGDESEDESESLFDIKKVNTVYSAEHIQKRIRERKRRNLLTGQLGMFNALQKFRRYHDVIYAFRKKQPQSAGISETIIEECSRTKLPPITIGKMKWYSFMDRKSTDKSSQQPLTQSFFKQPDVLTEQLERALELLVVRKEVITSDYSHKASVSITFTKKALFKASKIVGLPKIKKY